MIFASPLKAQDGSPRVVMHIGYHRLSVALVEADGVVVVFVEERALLPSHEGVVFLPLLLGHGAYQGALAAMHGCFLLQPGWGAW